VLSIDIGFMRFGLLDVCAIAGAFLPRALPSTKHFAPDICNPKSHRYSRHETLLLPQRYRCLDSRFQQPLPAF